jgi:hypothetical protein
MVPGKLPPWAIAVIVIVPIAAAGIVFGVVKLVVCCLARREAEDAEAYRQVVAADEIQAAADEMEQLRLNAVNVSCQDPTKPLPVMDKPQQWMYENRIFIDRDEWGRMNVANIHC